MSGYSVGEELPAELNLSYSERNVVLFVRSSCVYCTESMAFYRRLHALARRAMVPLFVVGLESQEQAAEYLAAHQLKPDIVMSGLSIPLKVRGTPTLFIVDKGGKVRHSWIGRLSEEDEKEVERLIAE